MSGPNCPSTTSVWPFESVIPRAFSSLCKVLTRLPVLPYAIVAGQTGFGVGVGVGFGFGVGVGVGVGVGAGGFGVDVGAGAGDFGVGVGVGRIEPTAEVDTAPGVLVMPGV